MEARGDEGQRRAKMGQGTGRRVRQGTAQRRDTGWAEGWLRRSGGGRSREDHLLIDPLIYQSIHLLICPSIDLSLYCLSVSLLVYRLTYRSGSRSVW